MHLFQKKPFTVLLLVFYRVLEMDKFMRTFFVSFFFFFFTFVQYEVQHGKPGLLVEYEAIVNTRVIEWMYDLESWHVWECHLWGGAAVFSSTEPHMATADE